MNCTDRYPGCHDHCGAYLVEKMQNEEIKKRRMKDKEFARAILPQGKENSIREDRRRKK